MQGTREKTTWVVLGVELENSRKKVWKGRLEPVGGVIECLAILDFIQKTMRSHEEILSVRRGDVINKSC